MIDQEMYDEDLGPALPEHVEDEKQLDLAKLKGHTPGPWEDGGVIADGDIMEWNLIEELTQVSILYMYSDGGSGGRCEVPTDPDARLIAAAPDLLAEVKKLRGVLKLAKDTITALKPRGLKLDREQAEMTLSLLAAELEDSNGS